MTGGLRTAPRAAPFAGSRLIIAPSQDRPPPNQSARSPPRLRMRLLPHLMNNRPSAINFFIVGLPLGLVCAIGFSIWLFTKSNDPAQQESERKFAQTVSVDSLSDDLRKLTTLIPDRHIGTATTAKNLTRAAAMIDGSLGPSNTGYQTHRLPGPAEWPLLTVTLEGKNNNAAPVWIVTAYDTRPATTEETSSAALAATLAAARALAAESPDRPIHFSFLPHANDPDSPVIETANLLRQQIAGHPNPHALLCIHSIGASDFLAIASRETSAAPLSLIDGLGQSVGAEAICLTDDTDLASILFEMNLPAVLVATQSTDNPRPQTLAGATNRLVTLILRCAKAP